MAAAGNTDLADNEKADMLPTMTGDLQQAFLGGVFSIGRNHVLKTQAN